jgi:DNA-binding response OmpR family regulator
VLLAEDDADTREITTFVLRREGCTIRCAADGPQALEMVRDEPPDVLLLDLRLPKLHGFEVLRTIRHDSDLPIIVVSARGEDDDVVRGLQLGADDYVTKPYSAPQLIARMRALVRRAGQTAPRATTRVEAAGMVLDLEAHELQRGGLTIQMTPTQARLLHALMASAGRVVPSARLVEQAWGFEGGDADMLKTHVSNIRKRLQLGKGGPGYIESIPTVGYLLQA